MPTTGKRRIVPSLIATARHALRDGHALSDEDRRMLLVALDELEQTRSPQGVREPRHGWQRGFSELIRLRVCPWCGHRVVNISVDDSGVTWACYDGCNP